ncbi:hypothetical protein WMY93_016610 [Mugilogobius chulae]|uniref:Uncharacterized protein n=1 Tax=Mugilogobius chulae TaxID=88201 RepID=A0AAW0NM07_9GOBI
MQNEDYLFFTHTNPSLLFTLSSPIRIRTHIRLSHQPFTQPPSNPLGGKRGPSSPATRAEAGGKWEERGERGHASGENRPKEGKTERGRITCETSPSRDAITSLSIPLCSYTASLVSDMGKRADRQWDQPIGNMEL